MRSATFIAILAVLLAFAYAGVIEEAPEKVIVGDGEEIAKTGVDAPLAARLTGACTINWCVNWCLTQMSPPLQAWCSGDWCYCQKL
jgi:hypothetical protein